MPPPRVEPERRHSKISSQDLAIYKLPKLKFLRMSIKARSSEIEECLPCIEDRLDTWLLLRAACPSDPCLKKREYFDKRKRIHSISLLSKLQNRKDSEATLNISFCFTDDSRTKDSDESPHSYLTPISRSSLVQRRMKATAQSQLECCWTDSQVDTGDISPLPEPERQLNLEWSSPVQLKF
jgi:hypothetical protein